MKRRKSRLLAALALLAVVCSGCSAGRTNTVQQSGSSSEQSSADAPAASQEGSTLTVEFEGKDLEGNTVTSNIFSQAKLTMVNVWATYCNPCLSEMPDLGELASEYERETFQVIGIVSDVMEDGEEESIRLAAELVEQTGADYTHLLLNASIYRALLTEVSAVPTTFFVKEDGTALGAVVGAREKAEWEELIDGLLEEL